MVNRPSKCSLRAQAQVRSLLTKWSAQSLLSQEQPKAETQTPDALLSSSASREQPAASASLRVLNDVNTFLERCPLEIAQKIVRLYVRDDTWLALVQEIRDRRGCARVPHERNCPCDLCDCMEWHDAYCDGTCERCQEYKLQREYEQHEKVCRFAEGCYTPASPYCNHMYN